MTSAQSLQHLIKQYPDAGEVVFAPTPLEILSLAELRRLDPDLALKLATLDGQRADRERTKP